MIGLLDIVAPARLGRGFRWLLASSWTSNLGDGIAIAAGTAPFWFAFAGSAVFLVVIWGQLRHIAHEERFPAAVSA